MWDDLKSIHYQATKLHCLLMTWSCLGFGFCCFVCCFFSIPRRKQLPLQIFLGHQLQMRMSFHF